MDLPRLAKLEKIGAAPVQKTMPRGLSGLQRRKMKYQQWHFSSEISEPSLEYPSSMQKEEN